MGFQQPSKVCPVVSIQRQLVTDRKTDGHTMTAYTVLAYLTLLHHIKGKTYNERTAEPHDVGYSTHNCTFAENSQLFVSNAEYLAHEKELPGIEL